MKYIVSYRVRLCFVVVVLLCLCTTSIAARVKLPTIFSDGMVIQRERPITIWGTADAGEDVLVKFLKKNYQTTADSDGNWSITLPAQKAGGPYAIQVNDQTINDILIGDVWLCSGQSNMELPVRRVMDMFADEVNGYENNQIRHIKVPNAYNFHEPQSDIASAQWKDRKSVV